jgi:hypothetical protein
VADLHEKLLKVVTVVIVNVGGHPGTVNKRFINAAGRFCLHVSKNPVGWLVFFYVRLSNAGFRDIANNGHISC